MSSFGLNNDQIKRICAGETIVTKDDAHERVELSVQRNGMPKTSIFVKIKLPALAEQKQQNNSAPT